jgi:hypothetical protein
MPLFNSFSASAIAALARGRARRAAYAARRKEGSSCVELSARDAEQVLEDIRNPPPPNAAALQAAKLYKERYGRVAN